MTCKIHIDNGQKMKVSKHNVFIFNWVNDYQSHIDLLQKTFQSSKINNRVCVFDQLTADELKWKIEELRQLNFGLFRYVAVVILDNRSTNEHFIQTSNNEGILLDSEILTPFKTNETLDKKPRLFVIQKLQDYSVEDDGSVLERQKFLKTQNLYKKSTRLYEGPEFSIQANESTDHFKESPFIKVLCQEFSNSTVLPMKQIFSQIRKSCTVPLMFGSNQRSDEDGILGIAIEPDDLRDYF